MIKKDGSANEEIEQIKGKSESESNLILGKRILGVLFRIIKGERV